MSQPESWNLPFEKRCTSLAMAMATAAQPSGDASGRQDILRPRRHHLLIKWLPASSQERAERNTATSYTPDLTHILLNGLHLTFIWKIFNRPKYLSFRPLIWHSKKLNLRNKPSPPNTKKTKLLRWVMPEKAANINHSVHPQTRRS